MNKPSDNSFNQQRIFGWYPIMTPWKVIIVFGFLGILYLILGIVAFANYTSLFYYEHFYTYGDEETHLNFEVTSTVKEPVIVQYELTAFYQNHQRFINGNSYCKTCDNDSSTLIINSRFNDSFMVRDSAGNEVKIDKNNLAFDSDKKRKDFKNLTDEEIVWAKIAPFPTFFKLYGVINQDLTPQNYTVIINNSFVLPEMSKKAIVLSKTSKAFGGQNRFVGIVLIIVGGVILALAVLFIVIEFMCNRKPGEYHDFFGPDFADIRVVRESQSSDAELPYVLPMYLRTTDEAVGNNSSNQNLKK